MNIYIGLAVPFVLIGIMIFFKNSPSAIEQIVGEIDTTKSLKQLVAKRKISKMRVAINNLIMSLKAIGSQTRNRTRFLFVSLLLIFLDAISGISFSNPFLVPVF